jgi:hypothetical protein
MRAPIQHEARNGILRMEDICLIALMILVSFVFSGVALA